MVHFEVVEVPSVTVAVVRRVVPMVELTEFFGEANVFEAIGRTVMVRPEHLRLSRNEPAQGNTLEGRIESLVFFGSFYTARVTLDGGKAVSVRLSPGELAAAGSPGQGDEVYVFWATQHARVIAP